MQKVFNTAITPQILRFFVMIVNFGIILADLKNCSAKINFYNQLVT